MEIIISFILVSFATISFMTGINVISTCEKSVAHNWYFFLVCCASSVWSVSSAGMLLVDNVIYAYFMRSLMFLSIIILLNLITPLICLWLGIKDKIKNIICKFTVITSSLIFPFIISTENVNFVQTEEGVYYQFNRLTMIRICFNLFLLIWELVLLFFLLCGLQKYYHKRQRFMARILLLCWLINSATFVPEILLLDNGCNVYWTTACTQFISVLLIYMVAIRYNITQITIKNVSEYIYSAVEAPVVVLSETGRIEIVNASASDFFGITNEKIIGADFYSIFAISKKNYDTSKKEKGVIIDGECLLNYSRCSLSISHIYDRYDELMGDIVVITDLTDKLEFIDQLNQSKEKAVQAMEAKSVFLANISHEIRTPMNAIYGMSEILLKREVPIEIRDEIQSIYNASKGLLSIINDILDISKIELGRFDIMETEYSLDSIILDVVNMIGMRLVDRQVYLMVEIQPEVPKKLLGDDIRLKQILINILGNAAKFTNKGYIKLCIEMENQKENSFDLHMTVQDTGIGIKKEDISLLFKMFNQVDTKKNRNISGTGLGLAITKNLVEMMGGTIDVTSTYGSGTSFHWFVKQKYNESETIGTLMDSSKEMFVIYEEEQMVSQYFIEVLEKLRLSYVLISCEKEIKALEQPVYYLVRKKYFPKIKKNVDLKKLAHRMILIMDIGDSKSNYYSQYDQISLPLFELQLIDILNDCFQKEPMKKSVYDRDIVLQLPHVSVLIVDDNITNIQVAKGLLAPFQMQTDYAMSGMEAIQMIKNKKYQLVFMDQMMPEMDGLETLQQIRKLSGEYFQQLPVVALSAYAIGNAREEFIQQGFDDFLAKPIEFYYLNQIIRNFLGKTNEMLMKQEEENSLSQNPEDDTAALAFTESKKNVTIPGIDMLEAIHALGDKEEVYHTVLTTYYSDLRKRRDEIPNILKSEDYHLFTIYVHAIKSASKSVGANSVSEMAKYLEACGKKAEADQISQKIQEFYDTTDQLIKHIGEYLDSCNNQTKEREREGGKILSEQSIAELKHAVNELDYLEMERIVKELSNDDFDEKTNEVIAKITEAFYNFDYHQLEQIVNSL